jgi:hypothetical protein
MDPQTDPKSNPKPDAKPSQANAGAAPAVMQAPPKVAPLAADRWQLGEFLNARHAVCLPAGTPFANVLSPEFWANIVRLRPDDIIEVRTEDRKFYAELLVLARGRNWATVAVIRNPVELKSAALPPSDTSAYKVEYAGSHAQWRVLRASDNSVMRDKFPTEDAALLWVRNTERAQAA